MSLLTVCITFCDKDFQYVERLLSEVRNHIKVGYDLIIVDNRDDKSEKLPFDSLITLSFRNVGCFIPRKETLSHINSKYIWYLDADDEIVDDVVESDFESNADVITFRCITDSGAPSGTWPTRKDCYYGTTIKPKYTRNDFNTIGPTLWNKFIKFDLFKNISVIPDIEWVCNEDNFLTTYLMKYMKSVYFLDKTLYQYNFGLGDIRSKEITMGKFMRLAKNAGKIYSHFDEFFTEKEKNKIHLWLSPEDSCTILLQLLSRSSPDIVEDEIKYIKDEFGIEIIQKALREYIKR